MASTPLLGLSLPADGTTNWGTLVNTSITALLDSAVAGTTTLSSDADVTLSATTEATNQARQAIILWTATGTATRTITAPAQSKTYVVINATGGTQSIVFRGTGPTTGVTIPAGKAFMLAWRGTDFVTVGATSVNLATDVTGVLGVANGGTGATSFGTRVFLIGNGTSAVGGGIFSHDGSTTYTMRPPNGGATGSVVLTMGPTSTAGSAEINLNAIGGGAGNGIINSTAPLELKRSGTTVATVDTNNFTLAASRFLTFTAATAPNYNIGIGTETIGGGTTTALFINPASTAAANVIVSASTVANAALWLKPNSTGSGVGIVGTVNDLNVELRRNQVTYMTLGVDGVGFASGRNIGLGGTAPSASGAGITFPATQSSSSDANTLDDYEEGSWTPTAFGNVTVGTTTYDANGQQGRYTKIGRQVTVSGYLSVASSTGVGALTVGNFPFASLVGGTGNVPNYVGSITFTNLTNGNSTNTLTSMLVMFGSGSISAQVRYVYGSPGLSTTYSIISTAFTVEFTLTYFTAT